MENEKTVEIDGSFGSGGGQIIRTALALSALSNKAVHIKNIRAKRSNKGLARQHLACVNAIAELCNARVKGNFLGSTELWFFPGVFKEKDLNVKIQSAGRVILVLQSLMPLLIKIHKPVLITLEGGTDVKGAPSSDYLKNVLLKLLNKLGYRAEMNLLSRGFYPKGGGKILFKAEPMKLKEYSFLDKGENLRISGISVASKKLEDKKVAERQKEEAIKILKEKVTIPIEIISTYEESLSSGSALTLWLECENSLIGSVAYGELGKTSENVAREAAISLIQEIEKKSVVDLHAADQLLPYLAIAGGSLKTSFISDHTKTNAFVIEKFLSVKFMINESHNIIECKKSFM